ncbi:hypothetical protein Tco_1055619 [Tanacetum coccineum]|uniref:Uncharacterized protein n=1 Tax=Tanacetum coccineum TaxID=301880 RepID=A0ABQ5H251_9ASTR
MLNLYPHTLDDEGKPLKPSKSTLPSSFNVVSKNDDDLVNEDNDSQVEAVFDETANLIASTSFTGGSDRGYDTNSLLEQWRKIKQDDDYDPYDEDLYESHDMSDHLQAICDDLDITVRGRKKK